MRKHALLILAGLVAFAVPASAQVTLDLINEYPATAVSGEADTFFATAVQRRSGGRVTIQLIPDAKSGLKSRDQLKAVTEGKFAMADTVGGTLAEESPDFLLSSLPFVTPSVDDARALYEAAKPLYERLFAERKQKLLYVVPWPPSGIWSAAPVSDIGALKALKIRTYDNTGTEVMAKVASSAAIVSFSELDVKLAAGGLNAVLSSGDGGAGRQLWKYLRHFSEVGYALPLSFGSMSLAVWESLDEAGRTAIADAAQETTARQWTALTARLAENFKRMRENGVVIDEKPPGEVMDALRAAAETVVAEWSSRAGPEAQRVLREFRARPR